MRCSPAFLMPLCLPTNQQLIFSRQRMIYFGLLPLTRAGVSPQCSVNTEAERFTTTRMILQLEDAQ
jgi:hypothetical protein